jgi:antitoxin component YwqK of YwqJK toxin-antitoxin module
MKYILSILSLILSEFAISQDNCVRDTLYYSEGKIELIYDYNKIDHEYCGIFISYDTSGIITSKGEYRSVDSVECFNCYIDTYKQSPDKWEQYFITKQINKIPVGEWRYYHKNGELKEKGNYCEIVHEYRGMAYPIEWEGKSWPEPVAGYLTFSFLKDGIWEYYDLYGNNIKTEEYVRGQLVFLIERN